MIEKIKIENLTVFENVEIDTNAPINVFIGENGTGKTQILKFINSVWNATFNEPSKVLPLCFLHRATLILTNSSQNDKVIVR